MSVDATNETRRSETCQKKCHQKAQPLPSCEKPRTGANRPPPLVQIKCSPPHASSHPAASLVGDRRRSFLTKAPSVSSPLKSLPGLHCSASPCSTKHAGNARVGTVDTTTMSLSTLPVETFLATAYNNADYPTSRNQVVSILHRLHMGTNLGGRRRISFHVPFPFT